jgi:biopolymer transport protein ExbD
MKSSRRLKRMSSKRMPLITKMNLTSLMDIFTILVFFLLVNSGAADAMDPPKSVELPESVVEAKPRETVVVFIDTEQISVQGKPVATMAEVLDAPGRDIEAVKTQLAKIRDSVIGPNTLQVSRSQEVTVLADKSVPFAVIKRVMSTCTSEGYGRISLAVVQKGAQVAQL